MYLTRMTTVGISRLSKNVLKIVWHFFQFCIFLGNQFVKHCQIVRFASSALMLLVGRQERHTACKKTERWVAGMVICLERGADLHMAQLMPLPLTCFSKIQIGFTFLVWAHLGSTGKGPLSGCVR